MECDAGSTACRIRNEQAALARPCCGSMSHLPRPVAACRRYRPVAAIVACSARWAAAGSISACRLKAAQWRRDRADRRGDLCGAVRVAGARCTHLADVDEVIALCRSGAQRAAGRCGGAGTYRANPGDAGGSVSHRSGTGWRRIRVRCGRRSRHRARACHLDQRRCRTRSPAFGRAHAARWYRVRIAGRDRRGGA